MANNKQGPRQPLSQRRPKVVAVKKTAVARAKPLKQPARKPAAKPARKLGGKTAAKRSLPAANPTLLYDRLLALIRKEWWTNAEAVTDAKGEATMPAFYGTHTVTGEFASGATITRKAVIGSGQPNRVELRA